MASTSQSSEVRGRPPRGTFLSVLIVAMASAITMGSLALIVSRDLIERWGLGSFPDWFNPFVIVFVLARLVALAAIWNLRRWGVYLFFLLESAEVVMGLFVFTSVLTFPLRALIAVPTFLTVVAIWYLALRPKWQAFT